MGINYNAQDPCLKEPFAGNESLPFINVQIMCNWSATDTVSAKTGSTLFLEIMGTAGVLLGNCLVDAGRIDARAVGSNPRCFF
jgi:hypothetical protein